MKRISPLRLSNLSLVNAFHFFGFNLQNMNFLMKKYEMDRSTTYSLGTKMTTKNSNCRFKMRDQHFN
jgi:hypothetical protein